MALPSAALAGAAGVYRAQEGPDVAARIALNPDGTFVYALSAGALDEVSQGTWTQTGDTVTLTTEPKPVPPRFEMAEGDINDNAPFLLVTWSRDAESNDGGDDGIAGIDFRIGCADGTEVEGYTQYYGWSFADDTTCVPLWIELSEPIYRVRSPRFALAEGTRALHFVLMPNDMGVIDLTGATIEIDGDRLLLRHPAGLVRFVRWSNP